jgi:predicted dehydrogenase
MLRAAIIGLGRWGQALVNSVQGKSPAIRFVAGHTRTPRKVEDFCRDQSIALKHDYAEILGDPEIDAVVLATPHSQHEEQIRSAAAAGKHVFVEKPFTLTIRSAQAALAAADEAGIALAVGYNRRFHPSMSVLRDRVRQGRFGVIEGAIAEMTAMSAPFMAKDYWRANPIETPAGAMTGLGVHAIDSMIDLFGRIDEAYCVNTKRAATLVDDTTSVLLRFASGVTGIVFCSLSTAHHYRLAVYGSKGLAEIAKPTLEEFRFIPAPNKPLSGPPGVADAELIRTPGFDTLAAELMAFAVAARREAPYPIPAGDILHGVAVFEAIVRSAETGKPVAVA